MKKLLLLSIVLFGCSTVTDYAPSSVYTTGSSRTANAVNIERLADGTLSPSYAALRTFGSTTYSWVADGMVAKTWYRASDGDGGQGTWYFDEGASDSDNGGTILAASDGSGVWRRVFTGHVSLAWWDITDDGATDETTDIQAAVTVAAGEKLVFPKYSGSIAFQGVTLSGNSIEIDLGGNTLIPVSAGPLLTLTGGFSNTTAVSAISTTTVDTKTRTTISVADASAFAVGDVIKVVSEDNIPHEWGTDRKIGEFSEVIAITEGTPDVITLNSNLFDQAEFSTNIYIAKLGDHSFKVYNGLISNAGSYEADGVIQMISARDCLLKDVHAKNLQDAFFVPISLYEYTVDDCSVINSENDPGSSKYGYGIEDKSSHNGLIKNFSANKVRHAVTSNAYGSATYDMRTGRTFGLRVVYGFATDCEAGCWDTHPDAVYTTFENCEAENSLNFGQSRSPHTTFINPIGRDLTNGIKFSSGDGGDQSVIGNRVINPMLSVSGTVFDHYKNGDTDLALTDLADVTIIGGKVIINDSDDAGCLFDSQSIPVDVVIKNMHVEVNDISLTGYSLTLFDQATADIAKVVFLDNTIDLKSVDDGTAFQIVRFDSDASGDSPFVLVMDNTVYGGGASIVNRFVYNTNAYFDKNIVTPAAGSYADFFNGSAQTLEDTVFPHRDYSFSSGATIGFSNATVTLPTAKMSGDILADGYILVDETIQGGAKVTSDADGINLTSAEMNGVLLMTGPGEVGFPDCGAASIGDYIKVRVRDAAEQVELVMNGDTTNDYFILPDGTALDPNDEADMPVNGNETCVVTCEEVNKWYIDSAYTISDGGVAD